MHNKSVGHRFSIYIVTLVFVSFMLSNIAFAVDTAPAFSKTFSPATIGPGSASTLTFIIDNSSVAIPVSNLAFTDTLPAGITIATPASAFTDCTDGVLTATDGGNTINLTGGRLGAAASCSISLNVLGTSTATNTTGDLTSSAGNSGTASASLTIDFGRPGFSKGFSPATIPLGGTSTLTFTIDNTGNEVDTATLRFLDVLPSGMKIAAPANASTDCGDPLLPATLTATSGTSVINLTAFGFSAFPALTAGSTCTVSMDVTTNTTGVFANTSGELFAGFSSSESSGIATAVLDVPIQSLVKSFVDDPVAPGGTVTLQFTVTNLDRNFAATSIVFDDDLDSVVTGLAPIGLLPATPCGVGSSLDFTAGVLSLADGNLPAGGSCTFSIDLLVPALAVPGTSLNTTSVMTAVIDGSSFAGSAAQDNLVVKYTPVLTKAFTDDPVGAGGDVTLEFSITNTSPDDPLSDIGFTDELTTFLPFPVTVTLPPTPDPPCGSGSSLSLVFPGGESQRLSLVSGILPAGGSCTFSTTITIPAGFPAGTYTNTTSDITAFLGSTPLLREDNRLESLHGNKTSPEVAVQGAEFISGIGASDDLVVVGAPKLLKTFTDDPVQPGGTVTLEFTLSHDALAAGDATGITFTDDLTATLAGLTATGLPLTGACDPDGPGGTPGTGTLSGTTSLTFAGGSLAPGGSCTFSVTLNVPGTATAGSHTNTTSSIVATVSAVTTTGNAASDDLKIAGLVLRKEFVDDPVIPGGTATLRFTIDNLSSSLGATDIGFLDDLSTVLPALTTTTLPPAGTACGGTLAGSTILVFSGGSLAAGQTCTFDAILAVPIGAASNTYPNTTSVPTATFGGSSVVFDSASDNLTVSGNRLFLTKEFTDDPAIPNGDVTLQFTLSNLDQANAASAIAFTDDLDATLTGLASTVVPMPGSACNASGTLSGAGILSFSGGSLAAGASCVFNATLQVPAGASPGSYTNQTSALTGTINGLGVTGDPAIADLVVNSVTLSKAFNGPATTPGTSILTFTIVNASTTDSVTDLSFTDDLGAVLPGLLATNLPLADACGSGSSISGTGFLSLTGGNLLPGGSCTIVVQLQVPAAALGVFTNTTSELTQLGLVMGTAASADLTILGTVGGTVSGLAGSGLVLQNNAGDNFPVAANGSFTFATPLPDSSPYAVTVLTPPSGPSQTCTVANGSGTLAGANVTDIIVTCTTDTFIVGGSVAGLQGTGLVLQNNAFDDLPVGADGSFTFTTPLADGSPYAVSVLTQPSGPRQTCTVSNATGVLMGSNVVDVNVDCTTNIIVPVLGLGRTGLLFLIFAMIAILAWRRVRI